MPLKSALELKQVDVDDLSLDRDNPRLPEDLQGGSQEALLQYLSDQAVLEEIITSLNDNGFFEHEPLIAYDDDDLGLVVVEGNRRLAALMVLTEKPEAQELGLEPALDAPPTAARLASLEAVPVYVVDDREEVQLYLGFRHIGGIKTWSAEAKARYLTDETDKAAKQGAERPFLAVARRVGSNSLGVRNSYTALALLRHARDEYGLPVGHVVKRRFGVWMRCMTAQDVRHYIGLNGARSYEEVRAEIEEASGPGLKEVLGDLTPASGSKKPLLNDSRDVTVYGRILQHDVAHGVLRRYQDLQIARQIVEMADLPDRVLSLRDQVDVAQDEAQLADFSDELLNATDALFRSARALHGTVQALEDDGPAEDEDD